MELMIDPMIAVGGGRRVVVKSKRLLFIYSTVPGLDECIGLDKHPTNDAYQIS
jgi:hypothetical protein